MDAGEIGEQDTFACQNQLLKDFLKFRRGKRVDASFCLYAWAGSFPGHGVFKHIDTSSSA
jgi:hypothetical protein